MNSEVLWPVGFGLLLTGLAVPFLRRRPVIVPLSLPIAFLMCEIGVFQWLWHGGWKQDVYITWLVGFIFVGLVLIYQSFGRRRWFIFRGGGFYHDMDAYAVVSQALKETLQLEGLPPATVIFRYDGWIGFTPLSDSQEKMLNTHLDDALDDTKWRKSGPWQVFFGAQWMVLILMLLRQAITMSGGM